MRTSAMTAALLSYALAAGGVAGCQGPQAGLHAQTVGVGPAAYPYVQGAPTSPGTVGLAGAPAAHTPAAVRPTAPATSFTVVATGDVLLHDTINQQAFRDGSGTLDYRAILGSVRPVISSADLASCHLEAPLAPPNGPFHGAPTISMPPQIVDSLADTGFDACSTASDHSLDQGYAGIQRTLDDLDRVHIHHAGTARTPQEAATPDIIDVRGVKVAHLSYTLGFNRFQLPHDETWPANKIDASHIVAAARQARAAGAQVVIVSLHWGTEYQHAPAAGQIALAQKLLSDPAIDLIVGHHAHVVQPFARATNGKWVAYGLGNLLAVPVSGKAGGKGSGKSKGKDGQAQGEGLIARFTFTRSSKGAWAVSHAEFIPIYIDQGPPVRVLDAPLAAADPGIDKARRRFLQGVIDHSSRVVYSRSALPALSS